MCTLKACKIALVGLLGFEKTVLKDFAYSALQPLPKTEVWVGEGSLKFQLCQLGLLLL